MFSEAQALMWPAFGLMGLFIVAEAGYSRWKGADFYRWGDTLCNLAIFVVARLTQPIFVVAVYFVLKWVQALSPFHIPQTPATTLLAVILTDFVYYWEHRLSHTLKLLWLFHEVHHSSRNFNLCTSFRLHWMGRLVAALFFIPLVFIGFKPEQITLFIVLNLFYQFLLHTQVIGKLGFLEGIFNTPSAHRVHHARNKIYIDRNFGGILLVWDRVFGTYRAETVKPKFGILGGFASDNPLTVHFHLLPIWPRLAAAGTKCLTLLGMNSGRRAEHAVKNGSMLLLALSIAVSSSLGLLILPFLPFLNCLPGIPNFPFEPVLPAQSAPLRLNSGSGLPSTQETVMVRGQARTYRVYVPARVAAMPPADECRRAYAVGDRRLRPVYLMFVFHGGGGNGAASEKSYDMDNIAEKYGFIAVYPDGLNKHWNDGRPKANPDVDDEAFIQAVINNLSARYFVPPRGVFVCGISNGAMFSNHLALMMSETIRAAASVAGDITVPDMQVSPQYPVSMLLIHGTSDGFVPFEGGTVQHSPVAGQVSSHQATFDRWVALDGGGMSEVTDNIGPDGGSMRGGRRAMVKTPAQVRTVQTSSGAVVSSVVIDRGGHTWPGHPVPVLMGVDGVTAMNFDASDMIGHFFAKSAGY